MTVSEAKRLNELEEENRQLKKLVADLSLDKQALKAVIEKSSKAHGSEECSSIYYKETWAERKAIMSIDRT